MLKKSTEYGHSFRIRLQSEVCHGSPLSINVNKLFSSAARSLTRRGGLRLALRNDKTLEVASETSRLKHARSIPPQPLPEMKRTYGVPPYRTNVWVLERRVKSKDIKRKMYQNMGTNEDTAPTRSATRPNMASRKQVIRLQFVTVALLRNASVIQVVVGGMVSYRRRTAVASRAKYTAKLVILLVASLELHFFLWQSCQ
jgi:hypothetical protein